jgi:predicted peroxiredoxin
MPFNSSKESNGTGLKLVKKDKSERIEKLNFNNPEFKSLVKELNEQ